MKLYISADLEGCCGVTGWRETEAGKYGYEAAGRQMTLEVAAACRAAAEAGYEVTVKDAHDNAENIDQNLLPRGTTLIRGWMTSPLSMIAGLDETYDGVIYIGYHSPAGSDTSPLCHTMNVNMFNWITINGRIMSEFGIHALLADQMGVPSLFLSGDKGICREAEEAYPGIGTFATKECIGNATWNLHPQDVTEGIEKAVAAALHNKAGLKPLEKSYTMKINFKKHQDARRASWYPQAKLTDPYTVEITADTPYDLAVARMFMTE